MIQDLDACPGFSANRGEVNTNIHKSLGLLGVVTNGSIRDLDELASGFQLLAGKIGPSYAYMHVEDTGKKVNIFGMNVQHNDLLHADRHGAVVIPMECIDELPNAIDLMIRRVKVIIDVCKSSDFNVKVLKKVTQESSEIH